MSGIHICDKRTRLHPLQRSDSDEFVGAFAGEEPPSVDHSYPDDATFLTSHPVTKADSYADAHPPRSRRFSFMDALSRATEVLH